MKIRSKKNSERVQKLTEQSCNFEVSVADIARRSERRAWWVAFFAVIMSVLLAAGYWFVMPLKEKQPYLIMADPYTGTSTLTKLTDGIEKLTANEAVNKSNVANFVIARESYDWYLINLRDWNVVNSMAVGSVQKEYHELFDRTNRANPDKLYGKEKAVRVKIKSNQLKWDNNEKRYAGAVIRFDVFVVNKETSRITESHSKIADMVFEYKDNLQMSEELWVLNPLGFRVTGYRVDPDGDARSTASAIGQSLDAAEQTEVNVISGGGGALAESSSGAVSTATQEASSAAVTPAQR